MDVVFLKIEDDTYLRAYDVRHKAPMVLLDFYMKYSYLIKWISDYDFMNKISIIYYNLNYSSRW